MGSSPRARGAAGLFSRSVLGYRIIPARAGSRLVRRSMVHVARDHPRARGEQVRPCRRASKYSGSSPRARGAAIVYTSPLRLVRIIPARAGSSFLMAIEAYVIRDHPRARGEQIGFSARRLPFEGSSPRARGAVRCVVVRERVGGIIPARAGSSVPAHHKGNIRRDHPRARGEQSLSYRQITVDEGSSPRARGAGSLQKVTDAQSGIIPARAGSRYRSCLPCRESRDHPRARGEQSINHGKASDFVGSSPRARGAAVIMADDIRLSGIIPARAGSSR